MINDGHVDGALLRKQMVILFEIKQKNHTTANRLKTAFKEIVPVGYRRVNTST